MTKNFIRIKCKEGELENIMDRLEKAQKEIYQCYSELEALGVLVIEKATTDDGDGKEAIE